MDYILGISAVLLYCPLKESYHKIFLGYKKELKATESEPLALKWLFLGLASTYTCK